MITAHHLSKIYSPKKIKNVKISSYSSNNVSSVKAIDDVSFYIPEGEVVGLVGLSGAGKTTLLKLIAGTLQSSEGMIRVFDKDPSKSRRELALKIGTVFTGQSQLWESMPLHTTFELIKSMYKINEEEYGSRLPILCDTFCLKDCMNATVGELSLGQRSRAEFVACMLHKPKLILMDEPTVAVDLSGKEQMNRYIKNYQHESGATIVMTTNDLYVVEQLCSRVMILDHGRVIFDGKPRRLKAEYASIKTIKAELVEGLPDFQDLPIVRYTINEKVLMIHYDSRRMGKSTILEYLLKQCKIRDIQTVETDLEDIIRLAIC